jgi:hypothetical protein
LIPSPKREGQDEGEGVSYYNLLGFVLYPLIPAFSLEGEGEDTPWGEGNNVSTLQRLFHQTPLIVTL